MMMDSDSDLERYNSSGGHGDFDEADTCQNVGATPVPGTTPLGLGTGSGTAGTAKPKAGYVEESD